MAHASRVSSVAAVAMFLGAVVAANMAVAAYGQLALVFTAWVVIPFDMLTRDLLHEKWRGDRLALRMGSLVLTGGLITVAINHASWRIAIASCVAFAMAMTVNSLVFERLIHRSRFVRMTASNAAALLGVGKYAGRYALAAHISGRCPLPDADNARTRMGRWLEPVAAGMLAEETGLKVKSIRAYARCRSVPNLVASPDTLLWEQDGQPAIGELKLVHSK